MSLKIEKAEIDGVEFETTQFDAMRGLELMGVLVTTIGPAFVILSNAGDDTSLETLAPVLAGALKNVKGEDLSGLALSILAGTSANIVDAKGTLRRVDILNRESFNKVFSGRLKTMFKVLVHALKVNYSDFGVGSAPDAPQETV